MNLNREAAPLPLKVISAYPSSCYGPVRLGIRRTDTAEQIDIQVLEDGQVKVACDYLRGISNEGDQFFYCGMGRKNPKISPSIDQEILDSLKTAAEKHPDSDEKTFNYTARMLDRAYYRCYRKQPA